MFNKRPFTYLAYVCLLIPHRYGYVRNEKKSNFEIWKKLNQWHLTSIYFMDKIIFLLCNFKQTMFQLN